MSVCISHSVLTTPVLAIPILQTGHCGHRSLSNFPKVASQQANPHPCSSQLALRSALGMVATPSAGEADCVTAWESSLALSAVCVCLFGGGEWKDGRRAESSDVFFSCLYHYFS